MALFQTNLGELKVTRHWVPIAPSDSDAPGKPAASQMPALPLLATRRPSARPLARSGERLQSVRQIVVGDTGRPGLRAAAAGKDLGQAFGHFLIDDRDIIECVPAITSRTGRLEHAHYLTPPDGGVDAGMLFVNLCYGGEIKRVPAFDRWVEFVAQLRVRFPPPDGSPFRLAREFAGRNDPAAALEWAGKTFAEFRTAVSASEAAIRVEQPTQTHDQSPPRST